jgi:hypothetical protein
MKILEFIVKKFKIKLVTNQIIIIVK